MLKAKLSDADKRALIGEFDAVLSLGLLEAAEKQRKAAAEPAKMQRPAGISDVEAAEIEALIEKRAAARKAKDWATADAIRDTLAARHVVVTDTPQGITWRIEK